MNFWERRKQRRHLQALAHHAVGLRNMREDVLSRADLGALDAALAAARRAMRDRDSEAMTAAAAELDGRIDALTPPCSMPGWRENFEVLVVALSVAMAFRAFFYQPFKIPTGSMQPTLFGIHSVEQARPGVLDHFPLKAAKWLITGAWYQEVRVSDSGEVLVLPGDDSKPGYVAFVVAGRKYYVPSDAAVHRRELHMRPDPAAAYTAPGRMVAGRVVAGDVLWAGMVTEGDFLFVNRWAWNFRHPRRGEVMVFSTTGIEGLPQGTHYIKRMCGLPNETLSIRPPELLIDGDPVAGPRTITRIMRREKLADWAPAYQGYQVIGDSASDDPRALRQPGDAIRLGPDQYFAMGDNTGNSRDSRYWGPVPERNLLGPPAVVYWPFTSRRWGRVE
jgi:signal peptidase I